MRNVIGERHAEKALIAGKLFTSEEAAQVGLIDEIGKDKDELMKKAHSFIEGQLKLPSK